MEKFKVIVKKMWKFLSEINMKSNPKIKPLFVIGLGIIITFSALIIIDLNSNTGNRDKINGQDV